MAEYKSDGKRLPRPLWKSIWGGISFEKISEWLHSINFVLLFFLMSLIVIDVIGRSLFSRPVEGTLDIAEIIMVFLVFLSLSYTEIKGMHVRALTLVERMSPKKQIVADILDGVLGMIFFFLMGLGGALLAWKSWTARQLSEVIGIPIYPGKFAIPVGCLLIFLAFLFGVIKNFRRLFTNSSQK